MGRIYKGSSAHLSGHIFEDFKHRVSCLSKPQQSGLCDLAACVLLSGSVNTSEWGALLPRDTSDPDSRFRYIHRILSNKKIEPAQVMADWVRSWSSTLFPPEKAHTLIMDQSQIRQGVQVLMVGVRVGDRALPLLWEVVETKGAIGFAVQEPLLKKVAAMLPPGLYTLMGDRFYGTSSLITLCQKLGWRYRIRLKGNLRLAKNKDTTSPKEAYDQGFSALEDIAFDKTNVYTNVGILHEDGHPEPWYIAMECPPTSQNTRAYGRRWGIEALFSDLKTRGFDVAQTQLQTPERISLLILVLSIAAYWATSMGAINPSKKNLPNLMQDPSVPPSKGG